MKQNPNCDGGRCLRPTGEVRVLPTGGDGNAILCRHCFNYEMKFRNERNSEFEGSGMSKAAFFDIPEWDSLKVYEN